MEPAWLSSARDLVGLREIKGAQHEPKILQLWEFAGMSHVRDDETAWCAAFVGGTLEMAGIRCSRKPNARSYMDWGIDVLQNGALAMPLGCVAVLSRPPSEWQGHVGYPVGLTDDGFIAILGGNQSDSVSIAKFQPGRVIAARWPNTGNAFDIRMLRQLPLLKIGGNASHNEA